MARLTPYDININCGADFVLSFLIRDGNGQLIDLTGTTITATVREFPESTEYHSFVATHNNIGGKITLLLPHEITALISYSYGYYDVYIEYEDDTREKVLYGNAKIIPEVTRFVNDGTILLMVTLSNEEALPVQGDTSRLYFCTESGIIYRWNGTGYVGVMRNSSVAIGETTTLPPGSDATVTNTGTIADLILNFGIPAGETPALEWGAITGTLSDQTDLQDALDLKANTADLGDLAVKDSVDWDSDIDNIPESFPPSVHDHDDRYYTESETDALLADKANTSDLGDLAEKDTVDWDSDIDNVPQTFPPSAHNHDDRYYTESETDALLADKADSADLGALAEKDTVDWDTDIDNIPSSFPPSAHNHDDRYYTETEMDAKLSPMYGYCETAADTVAKTVEIPNFTLVTGRTIFVKFKYANSASNPTLNVNSTGAIPLYRYGTTAVSTTAASNGWQANSVLALTYDGTGWIEHLWQNNTYNLANNSLGNGSFTVDSAVYRYQLLVHVDKETLSPFNNDNNVSGTTKTILTNLEFDPFGQIYYYDSTTTVNAGDLISGGALYYSRSGTDMRYSFNISASVSPLTAHKYVYIQVIPLANGKVKLASAMPLVQELPTTNDGYWYIFLGRASGDYALAIYPEKPVFYHDGTQIRQKFDPYLDYALNENAIQGTVSGSIVRIDDGTTQPVADLTVGIEPVQDLHGQEYPYPAGGGKNLINYVESEKGGIDASGTLINGNFWRSTVFSPCLPSQNYTMSVKSDTSQVWTVRLYFYDAEYNFIAPRYEGRTIVTGISPANAMYFKWSLYHGEILITLDDVASANIQVELGSSATTYAPYSNICPISGWTGANVQRTGKNLCPLPPEETKDGITLVHNADGSFTITGSATATTYFDFFSGNFDSNLFVGYKFKFISTFANYGASSISYRISKSDRVKIQPNNSTDTEIIVQDYGSELYAGIRIVNNYTLPSNGITVYPMLIAPNESEVFSPYLGTTYPISWQTEAGTVYGGSLDVTTGVLTVTHGFISDLSSQDWYQGQSATNVFYTTIGSLGCAKGIDGKIQCTLSGYKAIPSMSFTTLTNREGCGCLQRSYATLGICDSRYTDATSFKNSLSGQQAVFELATPVTYQLTPTEVTTLLGSNHIWADTGDSSLTYWKKTGALVLETRAMITQSSESVSIASKAYGIGDLFIFSNQLLRATSSIAIGDTIAIGTNAEAIDIATIISELNQRISALE